MKTKIIPQEALAKKCRNCGCTPDRRCPGGCELLPPITKNISGIRQECSKCFGQKWAMDVNKAWIYQFTLNGRLPGLNEIISACRHNKFSGAKQKRDATAFIGFQLLSLKVPAIRFPVKIHFKWVEPNHRRDRDNVQSGSKFILDAMQELFLLVNDSRKWVLDVTHDTQTVDKTNPRIEVTITASA